MASGSGCFKVAMINAATRMNVIVRNPGGSYAPGMFAALEGD